MQPSNDTVATFPEAGAVEFLYQQMISSWDKRDAAEYSQAFSDDATVVGFDGTIYHGRLQIRSELRQIFESHQTPSYVTKIKEMRLLAPGFALLNAIVGMVPPGQKELNRDLNAIQTILAQKEENKWTLVLLQNTPAQFHGRPELGDKMTEELNEILHELAQPAGPG